MRLIDADAVCKECIEELLVATCEGCVIKDYKLNKSIGAAPIRRGKWKLNKDGSGTCDQCHCTQAAVWDMDNWQNFCGHCGADMREVE